MVKIPRIRVLFAVLNILHLPFLAWFSSYVLWLAAQNSQVSELFCYTFDQRNKAHRNKGTLFYALIVSRYGYQFLNIRPICDRNH